MKVMWSFRRITRLGMSGYRIYLSQLHRVRCVVVGCGEVPERKGSSLLEAGAKVQVSSPTLTDGLRQLVAKEALDYLARAYQDGDLEGAFLYRCYLPMS